MQDRRATDCGTAWRARVVVRVPRTGDANLATSASRRLARADGVDDVVVADLCGLEPALAATNARFDVEIEAAEDLQAPVLERRLADAPGVERVEALRPRDPDDPR